LDEVWIVSGSAGVLRFWGWWMFWFHGKAEDFLRLLKHGLVFERTERIDHVEMSGVRERNASLASHSL
jgi:hypothetical protein